MKVEDWFKVGEEITVTFRIKDVDKLADFLYELNSPEKPLCDNIGVVQTSWSFSNIHIKHTTYKHIVSNLLDQYYNSRDPDVLVTLINYQNTFELGYSAKEPIINEIKSLLIKYENEPTELEKIRNFILDLDKPILKPIGADFEAPDV